MQDFEILSATVIDREIRGESSVFITVFSENCGFVQMMKKTSAKKTSQIPNLFDDISAFARADTPGSLKFMRDFEVLRHREGIAASYETFEAASNLAGCTAKNGRHIEDCGLFSRRLKRALDALSVGMPPPIVEIKFLYLLARDEGYAVREDFYAGLASDKKRIFSDILKMPPAELGELRQRAYGLLEQLRVWICANTDLML